MNMSRREDRTWKVTGGFVIALALAIAVMTALA
jgi:hypothetical protein